MLVSQKSHARRFLMIVIVKTQTKTLNNKSKGRGEGGKKLLKGRNDGIKSTFMEITIFKYTKINSRFFNFWDYYSSHPSFSDFHFFQKPKVFYHTSRKIFFDLFTIQKNYNLHLQTPPSLQYPQLLCTILKMSFEKITKYLLTVFIQHFSSLRVSQKHLHKCRLIDCDLHFFMKT